jgi:hypothetical protein
MPEPTLTRDEFAASIKAKYPTYASVPDAELVDRMLTKFPTYRDRVVDFKSTAAPGLATLGDQVQVKDRSAWESLKAFTGEATQGINPANWVKAAGEIVMDPATRLRDASLLRGYVESQGKVGAAAKAAYDKGDYVTAAAKGMYWLVPFLGPRLNESADLLQQGDIARGLGATVDVAGQVVLPKVLSSRAVRNAPIAKGAPLRNANPVEQAAVEFGMREGIPVDAATASGNRFVRGTQAMADRTMLGSANAARATQAQGDAFKATAGRLMDRTSPAAVTAEQAGEGLRQGVADTMRRHAGKANTAYAKLRKEEWSYGNAEYVPEDLPKDVKIKMRESLGELPTSVEIQAFRRIREELDSVPYSQGRQIVDDAAGEFVKGGAYSHGAAGAPVYHDILQAAPGTSKIGRGEVLASMDLALKTGRFTNAARGALDVARKRLTTAGEGSYAGLSKPILPPDAGMVEQAMLLPVDLRQAKVVIEPVYKRLMREKELTGVLQGSKARALTAMDNIMTAPDHAPLSVVDAALSDLKSMARSDIPELRGAGKGAAAFVVKHLDEQVTAAAAKAGPGVIKALNEGRAATKAKYAAGEILKSLGKSHEGVGVFGKATAARDAHVGLLRELNTLAPKELPKVGRAVLENMLTKATVEGGFNRAQGLQAQWLELGTETKRLLYKDPALIKDLDNFFLLAKKAAENPNPSGSAFVITQAGELSLLWNNPVLGGVTSVGALALSKLLHSPKIVRILNRGLMVPVRSKAATTAVIGELTTAARAAGIQLAPAVERDPAAPGQQAGAGAR